MAYIVLQKCVCGHLLKAEARECPFCGWDNMAKEYVGREIRQLLRSKPKWYRADYVTNLVRKTFGFRRIGKVLFITPIRIGR